MNHVEKAPKKPKATLRQKFARAGDHDELCLSPFHYVKRDGFRESDSRIPAQDPVTDVISARLTGLESSTN